MGTPANQTTFRSYLSFWSGQSVSLLGSSIAQFAIIWWITDYYKSALYLSVSSLVGFAPLVILGPFAGVLADRWNRRALIGIVDFSQALATVALILLFWLNIVSIWQVFALLALRGVFQAFHYPAVSALVPLMLPEDKLSRMNGLNYLSSGMINLIGPVVGALLLEFWRIYQILWIDAGTFMAALIPLLIITIPSMRKKEETRDKPSFRNEFAEGVAFIRSARGFLPLLMTSTAVSPLLTPLFTLLPYYVKIDHFGEAAHLAFVMAFFYGGMLAGGLLMSVKKGFKRKMVAAAVSVYIIFLGYALLALTPTGLFWFMAMGALIMAFGIPVVDVSVQTIIQTVAPIEMQGRVNSVSIALSSAARPLSMILSGAIVELTGTANLFLGCVVLGTLMLTLSWLFTDIKHVEETMEDEEEKDRKALEEV